MPHRITRRTFLGLSLATLASACAPKIPLTPTEAAAPAPTDIPLEDTTARTCAADDPRLRYTGRIDFTDPARPKFSAPAVSIRARFRGTGAAVLLEDNFKYGTNRNYYDILLDGAVVQKLAPQQGQTRYPVAEGLANAEHTLEIVKRTEAGIGWCKFQGFEFQGGILPAPAAPTRRIECIGDSITAGAGIEAENNSPECGEDGWGQPYNNARLAFGAVFARSVGADCHVSAVSGIGLTRNYSFQYDPRPMPEVYDSLFFEQTPGPQWDPVRFIPDAVLIGLGTNDFSPGESDRPRMDISAFVEAYLKFLAKLRGYYPAAHFFLLSSPMLGDHWPDASYTSAADQKAAIARVAEELAAAGDAKTHVHLYSPVVGMGCGTHPGVDQHAMLANQLAATVVPAMGW